MPKPRLLFVDDEPAIRLTLPAILELQGFSVTAAATVAEALEYITTQEFDVLISDLNIGHPGDGFMVVGAMRRTQPQAVTLILTGFPDFETAVRALREHVDDYVTKPADIDRLVSSIRERLKGPRHNFPEQGKRVSTVLRENAQQVIAEWFQASANDIELSRFKVSKKDRIDHLPAILGELANRIESGRFEGTKETRDAARAHGKMRAKQGFRTHNIASEARILHNAISKTLQEHLLSLDLSTLISDMMQIGESLDEQLEVSLVGYEEQSARKRA